MTPPRRRTDAEAQELLDAEISRLEPRRGALGEAGIWAVAGWTLSQQLEWEASALAWTRVGELSPEDPEAVYEQGVCLLELERLDEAIERFRRAIDLDAALVAAGRDGLQWMDADPEYRLGTALHAKGDLRDAIAAYERSAARNTVGVDALREVVRCRLALREPKEALDALARLERRAVRLSVRAEVMAFRSEALQLLREPPQDGPRAPKRKPRAAFRGARTSSARGDPAGP